MICDHVSGRLSETDQLVVEHVPPGGNWRDLPPDFPSARVEQIRRSAANGEGSRSTYYGRLRGERPSYTISTYFNRPGNGCHIHPTADRLITVREAARLQSFPDSFRFTGRGRARYLQVGNAVPPLLAYQVARALPQGEIVDLFSGAGGMSLGFQWAGCELVAAVDNNAAAVEAMRGNGHGADAALLADLGRPEELRRVIAHVRSRSDRRPLAVVGGPPCQGFSTAGNLTEDDPRNRLVFGFMDAVRELRPEYVVMENVPALMWRRGRGTLDRLRSILSGLGYRSSAAVLHAESFGVPQLRRRLILMAARDGDPSWPAATHQLVEPAFPAMQPGSDRAPQRPPVSVEEAIGDLPAAESHDPDVAVPYATGPASDYQRWARGEIPVEELAGPRGVALEGQLSLGAIA